MRARGTPCRRRAAESARRDRAALVHPPWLRPAAVPALYGARFCRKLTSCKRASLGLKSAHGVSGSLGPGAAGLAAAGAVRGPEEGRSCRSADPLLLPAWGCAGPGVRLQLQLLRLQKQVGTLGIGSKTQLGRVKKETCSVPFHLGRADPGAKLPAINTASPRRRWGRRVGLAK